MEHLKGATFVLSLGGSFNPIHDGHIAMMVEAKAILERLYGDGCVKCGFFAAALDDYVKTKADPMKGYHRLNTIELASERYPFIARASQTYSFSGDCMKREVPIHLTQEELKRVCYVVLLGGDYIANVERRIQESRQSVDPDTITMLFSRGKHIDHLQNKTIPTGIENVSILSPNVIVVQQFDIDMSSTKIRAQFKSSENVEHIDGLDDEVLQYMKDALAINDLYL